MSSSRSTFLQWGVILGILSLGLSAWVIFGLERIEVVRFATFNTSMIRDGEGRLARDLAGEDAQARAVAEVIQRVVPDVLLLNEFDLSAEALTLFVERYLEVGQNGAPPMRFDYSFFRPIDMSGGMVLLSRYPILVPEVRTFRQFPWQSMPSALLPDDPDTPRPADRYPPEVLKSLRLSSKSHWDVPVVLSENLTVHVLASNPAAPSSDDDRRRNHDEIRFWADYIVPQRAGYIVDDRRQVGGLAEGAPFVILGDLNADPVDGDSLPGSIGQLLEHPRVQGDTAPRSDGGVEQSQLQWEANSLQRGDSGQDTADLDDRDGPGNLRLDYVLPSVELEVEGLGVFWPRRNDPRFALVGTYPFPGSAHRLVWLDVRVR